MRKHKDETLDEFVARLAAKNSKRDMGWLGKNKSASAEIVEEMAKGARKERKKREAAERLDERSFNAAEKEYDRECREDAKAKRKGEAAAMGALPGAIELVQGTGLDLNVLRIANVTRSESKKGFNHPLDAWSIAEWTNAMQGEAGEAGNIAKKLIRIRYNTRGNRKGDGGHVKLLKALAQEIADAVVYADLCLASEGISLSDAVRDTFNRKSKEIGFNFRL